MDSQSFAGILGGVVAAIVLVAAFAYGPMGPMGKTKPAAFAYGPMGPMGKTKPAAAPAAQTTPAAPGPRGPVIREVPN
jgi:hypothetical protein